MTISPKISLQITSRSSAGRRNSGDWIAFCADLELSIYALVLLLGVGLQIDGCLLALV